MKIRIYMRDGSHFLVEHKMSVLTFYNEILNRPGMFYFQFDNRIINLAEICWIDVLKD